jgi:excisionase family DNA binding protein
MRALLSNFSVNIQAAGESLIQTIRSRRTAWKADELADVLSLSQKHILKLAKEQRIPSYRLGGAVRFDPGAVANWLEEKHVG